MPRSLLFLMLLLVPGFVWGAPIAKVTGAIGEVAYRTGAAQSYRGVAPGQELSEGGWVKTGPNGWLEITLADKSRMTLANDSEMELTRFAVTPKQRSGMFTLVQGKLRASVLKLAGKQTDLKVKSGTAVAGVKGTEFLMLSKGPANVFFGNEGTVAVSGLGDEKVPLFADTMTQTTRGNKPAQTVKLESGSSLAKARAVFEAATGTLPPAEWAESNALPEIIARWDINHGHYLADAGRYQEALQVFQVALDLASVAEIRADAYLERGGVFARFQGNPEAALGEYLLVLELYPNIPQRETALYNVGQTLFDMGRGKLARARFQQYLDEYPQGRYRSSVETLLRTLDKP